MYLQHLQDDSFCDFLKITGQKLDVCAFKGALFPNALASMQSIGFSYAEQERNHRKLPCVFAIEHVQVRHAPPDVFEVNSICLLEVFVQCRSKECKFMAKSADKRMLQTFVKVVSNLWSKSKA